MAERVEPTDPGYEAEQGRVPVWLDAYAVRVLATTCICNRPTERHERYCQHVRWRADAALHKAGLKRPLRLPEVREALAGHVRSLAGHGLTDGDSEVAFGDAVEEVHHLLDPAHGGEPGDVLLRKVEVEAAHRLWKALDAAMWPLDPLERARAPKWHEVTRRAAQLAHLLL